MFYYHTKIPMASSLLPFGFLPFDLENLCCHTEVPCNVFQMDPSHYEHE